MVAENAPETNSSSSSVVDEPATTPAPAPAPTATATEPRIRLRQKTPITAPRVGAPEVTTTPYVGTGNPAAVLQRTMEALYEAPPEIEDNNEEIRKLDSQLDHLNDYMEKVEERLKEHNERITAMLQEQKAEREKRRQSFHERMQATKQEDDDFQAQLAALLNRVDVSRKRGTVIESSDA
uniref:Sec2p domain-containing protein n=1 Tax=Panagrellus redivivus TaxID=6233 RepID=A0A7E4VSR3_PANRE